MTTTAPRAASRHPALVVARRRLSGTTALAPLVPGFTLCAAVAVAATAAGRAVPSLGGPVFALLFGIAAAAVAPPGARSAAGVRVAGRQGLQVAIVALAAGLSLHEVAAAGIGSLPVMIPTLIVALVGARWIGRALRVDGAVRTLIGVGTAICGASAIAAAAPVIAAGEAEVAYAVSTIFVFNVVAVLLFPFIGHALGLSQHAFGLWAGTAVNDTSSVVAAAFAYGHAAGTHAVVVKLTRSLAIVPVCLGLGWLTRSRARGRDPRSEDLADDAAISRRRPAVPWFIFWFLVVAVAGSVGIIPRALSHFATSDAPLLVTAALAAIGLSVRLPAMRRAGARPLLLGAALWASVGTTSLAVQYALGRLHP